VDPADPQRAERAPRKLAPSAASQASHVDALLDEALAETFPASDPVALPWRGGAAPEDI
jgi:hypothetical protein